MMWRRRAGIVALRGHDLLRLVARAVGENAGGKVKKTLAGR